MISLFLFALRESEDPSFIAKLYMEYKNLIRSEIYKIYPNRNDMEDIMQNVFVRLIRHEDCLHNVRPGKMTSYIIRTTHTTVATFLAKKHKDDFILYLEELEDISCERGALEKLILDMDAMEQYRELCDALKPRERLILQLKYDLEYTDDEIAEYLDLKPRSVHVLVYKARKNFEKLLDNKMKRDKRIYGENAVSPF